MLVFAAQVVGSFVCCLSYTCNVSAIAQKILLSERKLISKMFRFDLAAAVPLS